MKALLSIFIFIAFFGYQAEAQCHYIPTTTVSPDTLTWTFYGGTEASYGCAPIDPNYWISGYGDSVKVTFVNPQSYPTFRVWGMNTDDSAAVFINGLPFALNGSSASYNAKVVCGLSPGPNGIGFSAGNLVGVLTPFQGNYSYQDIQLNATNVTSITVKGLAGAGWGFAGVSVNCPLTGVCDPTAFDTTATISCGDSVIIGGTAYRFGGVYADTIQNAGGCDSIITLHLAALGDTINISQSICQGDSFYFYADEERASGIYTHILYARNGCDTLVRLMLTVNPLPVVTFSLSSDVAAGYIGYRSEGLTDTTYDWCEAPWYPNQFMVIGGSPVGGSYAGPGIVNGVIYRDSISRIWGFDSTLRLSYIFTDTNGCSASASASGTIIFDWCEGITEVNNTLLNIYPNPAAESVNISVDGSMQGARIQITDATGRCVSSLTVESTILTVNTGHLANGLYILQLNNTAGQSAVRKLIIER